MAFLYLRSIFIVKQVVTSIFLCVACIIIEPCLCLFPLEILKDNFEIWNRDLLSYIQNKKIVLLIFECNSTAVKTVTQILQLLFLCRVSQRKRQLRLAWIPI